MTWKAQRANVYYLLSSLDETFAQDYTISYG